MRDEETSQTRGHMLDFLVALLDDCNDLSWQSVRASHAVLLCRMEQCEMFSNHLLQLYLTLVEFGI